MLVGGFAKGRTSSLSKSVSNWAQTARSENDMSMDSHRGMYLDGLSHDQRRTVA
jgi:hypothetical protein